MPSDLFEYLLRYLLSWEGKCNMKDNDNLAQLVFDLDGKIR